MLKMEIIQRAQLAVDTKQKLKEERFKKQTLPHNLIPYFSFHCWSMVLLLKGTLGARSSPGRAGIGSPGRGKKVVSGYDLNMVVSDFTGN